MKSINKIIEKEIVSKGLIKYEHLIKYEISDMIVREVWENYELENALDKGKDIEWNFYIDLLGKLCTIRFDYGIEGNKKTVTNNFTINY